MTHDPIIDKITDYVVNYQVASEKALQTARLCLADALGCAMLALQFQECRKILGPWVPGTTVPGGCHIPGLDMVLDPVMGAFTLGTMIRWLDYNDTFLAKEWAHPSDNIGGLLPLMDFISNRTTPLLVKDLLVSIIKAYEIQGCLAIENSFNEVGLDHVILVKVAQAALATQLLGGTREQIYDAVSQAFIDLGPMRTYRHAPNTGSRKSWAAGDAASRGVALALLTLRGEPGYQTPLSAPKFGLEAVLFKNRPLKLAQPFGTYIIENILLKISYPAEFHAQTAVEAAVALHPHIPSVKDIASIEILTHEPAMRIIDKKGPLKNPADRDHCMQYMVAIALIEGTLRAEHYQEEASKDPRIDELRSKITIRENPQYTQDYYAPEVRSIASSLTITFKDGRTLGPHAVEFPLGHKRRREEGIPLLFQKLKANLSCRFSPSHVEHIVSLFQEGKQIDSMSIPKFIQLFLHSAPDNSNS